MGRNMHYGGCYSAARSVAAHNYIRVDSPHKGSEVTSTHPTSAGSFGSKGVVNHK